MTLQQVLQDAHTNLKAQFSKDAQKDEETAKRLEKFLDWVVYGKEDNPPSDIIDKELTEKIARALHEDMSFRRLFTANTKIGKKGEKAFASAILKILNQMDLSKVNATASRLKQVIIGEHSATIMAQEMCEEDAKNLEALLNSKKSIRNFSYWDARQGKIDIDMSSVVIQGELTPLAKELLQLTASVKNYKDLNIKLENVDRKKAYLAVMSEIYPHKKDLDELEALWVHYQENHIGNDTEVETHIQHLINLYSLTGYGQTYIKKLKNKNVLERKYAKFLMVNDRGQGKIYIRSTDAIIKNEIFGEGTSHFSGHVSNKDNNKYKAYYNVPRT